MESVGIRELAERASAVISEVESSGRPTIITRHGRPVAVVSAVDEEALLDYVLANAPEFVADMRAVEDRHARGEDDSVPLAQLMAEIHTEEAAEEARQAAAGA